MILHETEIDDDLFEVKINFGDLNIDKLEIELSLGYTAGQIPDHFKDIIDEIVEQLPNSCNIKAGYRVAEIKKTNDKNDGLFVSDVFFKMDKLVTSQLKKSERAALFICTIGPAMETWAKQLIQSGDPMTGFFADTVASVTAEAAVNLLHDHIGEKMRTQNLFITNRYSPGYCNWFVNEQHLLFSFFPEKFCGVTLTDSALMIPIKSVSGIIGIGSDVKWKPYLCDTCGIKDCTYRSKRAARLKNKSKEEIVKKA